jgi:tetratricopeptide (TPR) repeat protein
MRPQWIGATVLVLSACASQTKKEAATTTPPAKAATVESAPRDTVTGAWAKGAFLFDDLGTLHRAITTSSQEAQQYFDQGLRLTYGFNHDEATRSFARAAELDPQCASCFWGVALTLGPNYNAPMLPDRAVVAWAALERAKAFAPRASRVEQALIGALAKRYKGPQPLEPPAQQPFSEAYAAAMTEVANQFPDDLDVQVLYAESKMDTNPWKLWSHDGKPAPGTDEIITTLESVLARDPNHPGANHYYIHTIEPSPHPERALPSAERMAALLPDAGHTVHMPAHIFQRVGRYADAAETNRRAIAADRKYLAKTTPPGYYPMYLGHNYGFLAFAASMEGRGDEALAAARESAKAIPPQMLSMMPGMDFFVSEPLLVMVRFARWDELIKEPRPEPKYPVLTALWLHAHGMALAARGRLDEAAKDHDELMQLREKTPVDVIAGLNPAKDLMAVAGKILEARLVEAQKKGNALALWAEAVKLVDGLAYSEPADWFYPVRHFYGAALLTAGKPKEAEAVYREDLQRNPKNGWSLCGLAQALKAQKRRADASAAEAEFKKAWEHADTKLTASIL